MICHISNRAVWGDGKSKTFLLNNGSYEHNYVSLHL